MLNLLQEVNGAKRIGITGHLRPDGDCTGSSVALYLYLKKCLPEADITVYLEEASKIFYHIAQVEQIDTTFQAKEDFDVFFCLDATPERCGDAKVLYDSAKKKINIDHHVTNSGCGDVNLICPEIGSCAELIYSLIPEDKLDKDIAKALFIGMIHDTGVFQYSNTLPSTLVAASKLIQYDIDFANLIQQSFYEKSYKQTRIMAEAVLRSKQYLSDRCVVSYMTLEDMRTFDATNHDLEGIINRLRQVAGTDCAVFMYEIEEGNFKVSLRTSESVDATKIASKFGGGGHIRAAGCSVHGTYETVTRKLLEEIAKEL